MALAGLASAGSHPTVPPRESVLDPRPGLDALTTNVAVVDDTLRICEAPGKTEASNLFMVIDQRAGDAFTVEVLEQVEYPHTIRVAWSAQIPRTHEAVTVYFWRDQGAWYEFHDFANGVKGQCGQVVGQALLSDTFEVQVDFGGQDVKVTSKTGSRFSVTVTVGVQGTFQITVQAGFDGADAGRTAGIAVKYEQSVTVEVLQEYVVETHGYKKSFSQDYKNLFSDPLRTVPCYIVCV